MKGLCLVIALLAVYVSLANGTQPKELAQGIPRYDYRGNTDRYYRHRHGFCRCLGADEVIKACFLGTNQCEKPNVKDCLSTWKNRCRCPRSRPIYRDGKCLRKYECPMVDQDAPADRFGHLFLLNGAFSQQGVGYGFHLAIILSQAHHYHSVLKMKVDDACARVSRDEKNRNLHLSVALPGPVKLLDNILPDGPSKGRFTGFLGSGTPPNINILHKDCKVEVQELLDLRRFLDRKIKLARWPAYILFKAGKGLFISHIPVSCGDFQEVLQVKLRGKPLSRKDLEEGVAIEVRGKGIKPHTATRLTPKTSYRFTLRDECEQFSRRSLLVVKSVNFDTIALNNLCSKQK